MSGCVVSIHNSTGAAYCLSGRFSIALARDIDFRVGCPPLATRMIHMSVFLRVDPSVAAHFFDKQLQTALPIKSLSAREAETLVRQTRRGVH